MEFLNFSDYVIFWYIEIPNPHYNHHYLYMIFEQNCNNLNIKYYDDLIKIDIENIKNDVIKFKIYKNILEIFKLNKVNMIIKFNDVEYIIFTEDNLLGLFKNFVLFQ